MAPVEPDRTNLYAFDVGNTSLKAARRDPDGWTRIGRVETHPCAELPRRLRQTFSGSGAHIPEAEAAACSVQPDADEALRRFWRESGGGPIQFFGRDLPVPIPTNVPEPERVGADRLLLALGARQLAGAPCIVVSAGTAITMDVVNADGAFAGGAIAPGFGLAARALHEGTAFLPVVDPGEPPTVPGRNTEDAIRLGIVSCCTGGVLRLVHQYDRALGTGDCPILLTGGDAERLLPDLPSGRTRLEPELIFIGMAAALGPQG